jgi:hypothetical protein
VTIQPTRIDWQLVPFMNSFGSGIPTIGLFEESFNSFQTLMLHWTEIAPPTQYSSSYRHQINRQME